MSMIHDSTFEEEVRTAHLDEAWYSSALEIPSRLME